MRNVAIVGSAMRRIGKFPELSVQDLGWPVVRKAIEDAGVEAKDIQATYCGSAFSGRLVGQRVLRPLGMLGIPVINCENACSSGGTAFREAWMAIANGRYDMALVIGIDKLTALGGGVLPGQPDDWDVAVGLTMPALYAMRARRYMHEHKVTADDIAKVAVKSHKHAKLNPYAQFQNEVTLEDVRRARPVAEPFTLLHCCPTGDGAAALILCSEDKARQLTQKPVFIRASVLNSGKFKTGFRDMTVPEITMRAVDEIYASAGMGPDDIDVAEVHDAFTIAELLYYEALGFCGRGEAVKLLDSGATSLGGRIPVNVSGGLLCKGHPVGATGVAQLVELTWQLRGQAGERQVEGAKVALAHCTGGGIAGLDHGACSISILTR
jgi:benzoylsuccinyl-CoA thiolase BbsB subunit